MTSSRNAEMYARYLDKSQPITIRELAVLYGLSKTTTQNIIARERDRNSSLDSDEQQMHNRIHLIEGDIVDHVQELLGMVQQLAICHTQFDLKRSGRKR